jgi:hypothetical protein
MIGFASFEAYAGTPPKGDGRLWADAVVEQSNEPELVVAGIGV